MDKLEDKFAAGEWFPTCITPRTPVPSATTKQKEEKT